ncbi:LysE family translocator [Pseudomonas sp. NPDC078700]|uniref:LysE family translocator n=1 Tax=Pseudomonas sp. NPDC078700 TaxID=3364424 RepID=UPI0037C4F905
MESTLPFLLFAFVAAITPGPTNILVLSFCSRRGLSATVPVIISACIAAAAIVLAVGLGVGETLLRFPLVQQIMAWTAVLWLTWLAWQIFQSPPPSLDAPALPDKGLTPLSAAFLQVVNPKVWMMAVAVVSVFVGEGDKRMQVMLLSLIFLLTSLPCMTLWALLGQGSARVFRSPQGLKRMNQILALMLLASAWMPMMI